MESQERKYLIDHGFDVKSPFDAEAVETIMKDYLEAQTKSQESDSLPCVTISSTNSELGSYHWFHTIISRHKSIGEFLKDRIPEKHLIYQWGQKLYETSQELIKGYEHIWSCGMGDSVYYDQSMIWKKTKLNG
jgi:hypothetical protein